MLSGLKFAAVAPAAAPAKPEAEKSSKRSHKHSKKDSKSHKKSSHKHKKDKHEKKSKRQKVEGGGSSKKHRGGSSESGSESSGGSSSSDSEGEAAQQRSAALAPSSASAAPASAAAPAGPSLVRDSWMTPHVKTDAERAAEASKREAAAAAAESARVAAEAAEAERKRIYAEGGLQGRHRDAAGTPASDAGALVGDGGAGWRAKALKRARERAQEGGSSSDAPAAQPVEEQGVWGQKASASSAKQHYHQQHKFASQGARVTIDREQQRRDDANMAAAGMPTSFGRRGGGGGAGSSIARHSDEPETKRHSREDADTSMELVETEDEVEAREARERALAARSGAAAAAAAPGARSAVSAASIERARLMKRPAPSPAPSPPVGAAASSAAAAPSTSSWRDKIRSNLTASAAPRTPEGDTAALFSTPTTVSSKMNYPTPSPLPSPSPSPPPPGSGDTGTSAGSKDKEARFAGMLSPQRLGMDGALGVVMEERVASSSAAAGSSSADLDTGDLPGFAASFVTNESGSSHASASSSGAPLVSLTPSAPKGASDAELNKLNAAALKAKLLKQTALYESLQAQIAAHKEAAKVHAEAAQLVTHSASSAQHEQLHAHAAAVAAQQQPQQRGRPSLSAHAASIQEKIRLLRSTAGGSAPLRNAQGHEVVVLHSHDAHGRPIAAAATAASAAAAAASSGLPQRDVTLAQKRLAPNIDPSTGERVAYFADDVVDQSLSSLVQAEKLARQAAAAGGGKGAGHDLDRDWAQSIMRNDAYKHEGLDEQFDDTDFDMSRYDRSTSLKNQKRSVAETSARARQGQIQAAQRHENQISKCWYCLSGSKELASNLIVAVGVRMYLSIPRVNWITPGHVVIAPSEHVLGVTHMEDDCYEELVYWKKHLVKCFEAQSPKKKCVFIETVYDLNKNHHTIIHCIPLEQELYEEAEMYFAKAIDEADEEWSTHKKRIRADQDKGGVRKAVPKNFNYFSVEFGLSDGGIAHTIEDASRFPEVFGLEVLVGMLGESAQFLLRNRRASPIEEKRRVEDMVKMFAPFDWTKRLAGGGGGGGGGSGGGGRAGGGSSAAAAAGRQGGHLQAHSRPPPRSNPAAGVTGFVEAGASAR